tara:strand:- start:4 stop:192 length:189 start_codon:yes stop_codon:yes gene_type:complete
MLEESNELCKTKMERGFNNHGLFIKEERPSLASLLQVKKNTFFTVSNIAFRKVGRDNLSPLS